METRDLKYFVQIAELGSVHAAASRVGRTQPALTKSIKRLETEIGGKLFFREGRNIELTSLGIDLMKHAAAICRTVDSTLDVLRGTALGERGLVRLGISPTSAHNVLPDVIEALVRDAPDLRYQVMTGTPKVLRDALRTHEVDLVIGPTEIGDTLEFRCIELHRDEVVVAAGPAHPLSGKQVTIADLSRYDWLLPDENIQTRRWLVDRMSRMNIAISIKMEASSLISMRLNVIRGNFMTFIARSDMSFGDIELLREIDCPQLVLEREIALLHLTNRPLPPAALRFMTIACEMSSLLSSRWSGNAASA